MSDFCPQCGAAIKVDARPTSCTFQCGTAWHFVAGTYRGQTCYETEIERLKAERARIVAFLHKEGVNSNVIIRFKNLFGDGRG